MSINEKVSQIVKDHSGVENIAPTTRFDDLPIDSLEFLAMVKECEDVFHVEIGEKDLGFLASIGELSRYIENRAHDYVPS